MSATRRLAILCAISCALAAPACGRYGPPVRPASEDSGHFDNAREEAVPYIFDGLIDDVEPEAAPPPEKESQPGE